MTHPNTNHDPCVDIADHPAGQHQHKSCFSTFAQRVQSPDRIQTRGPAHDTAILTTPNPEWQRHTGCCRASLSPLSPSLLFLAPKAMPLLSGGARASMRRCSHGAAVRLTAAPPTDRPAGPPMLPAVAVKDWASYWCNTPSNDIEPCCYDNATQCVRECWLLPHLVSYRGTIPISVCLRGQHQVMLSFRKSQQHLFPHVDIFAFRTVNKKKKKNLLAVSFWILSSFFIFSSQKHSHVLINR